MSKLKISIITPSFNQGQFIEQTIQSVLSQDYPNIQYIIMDGGSTDNTLSILKKYKGKLTWFSRKDKGQSDAINKGLQLVTGDIVAWLNSDDYYLPGTLNKVTEYFELHKEAQWVSGDYLVINEKGKEIHSFVCWYKRILSHFSSFFTLSFTNYINQPSTFWRKSFQNQLNLLNEELSYCMDYDLWLRFMKQSPVHIIRSPLSAFRVHSVSKGGSQFKKQFKEELKVIKDYRINPFIYFFHNIHNKLIVFVYSLIK